MKSIAATCILTLSAHSAIAEDWLEFRGPNGQGHTSADLPIEWSESKNIVWKVPVAGSGWSSPVVAGGVIYLTTSVGDGEGLKSAQSLRLIKLNAGDGKEIFNIELFQQRGGKGIRIHKKNSHASPTPILEGDRIYVHFGPHGTACVNTNGKVLWKKVLKYSPTHGNGGSPAVCGDKLIICCDGSDQQFVVGLNKHSGDIKWKRDRNMQASRGFSFCTPTIMTVNGKPQAICPGSGKVISYDPETGDEIWHVDYGQGYSVVPRPVIGDGVVYVCNGFADSRILAIDPTGKGDVTDTHIKWKLTRGVPMTPSLLLVGKQLYFVSDRGIAMSVDAQTGGKIWQERLGGSFSASPTYANGRIYFQSEKGITTVVQAGPNFEVLAKNKIANGKEKTFASFGIVDDAILLRSENHLYRIGE